MRKPNIKHKEKRNRKKKAPKPLPHFKNLEEEVEFWETHDLTDYREYWREVKDVKIELAHRRFRLEEELAEKIDKLARQRGVSSETLVHLWLQQKLSEALKREKRRQKVSTKRTVASQYA
jgi:predicted DNA binding CopG/RHH family protein